MDQRKNQDHPGIGEDQQALKLLIERFKKYAEKHMSGVGPGDSHQSNHQQGPQIKTEIGNNEQMPGQARTSTGPGAPADQQCPTKQALQQLLLLTQSLNTPEQKDQILQILKNSTPLMASFMKQRQQCTGQPILGTGGDQQTPGSRRLKLVHQGQSDIPMSDEPSGSGCPVDLQTPAVKQALQQLLAIIKSPITPEKQAQILQIIKSNPELTATFLKQRRQTKEQRGEGVVPLYPNQVEEEEEEDVVELHNIISQLGLGDY